jgi:hypothetical protein
VESRGDGRGTGSTGAPRSSGSGTDSGDAWASVLSLDGSGATRCLVARVEPAADAVNDFDVYTFYAEAPAQALPAPMAVTRPAMGRSGTAF